MCMNKCDKWHAVLAFFVALTVVLIFGWGLQQRGAYFRSLGQERERLQDQSVILETILDLRTMEADVQQLTLIAESNGTMRQIVEVLTTQDEQIDFMTRYIGQLVDQITAIEQQNAILTRRTDHLELNNLIHARWHMRHSPFWSMLLDNAIRGFQVTPVPVDEDQEEAPDDQEVEDDDDECNLPGGG